MLKRPITYEDFNGNKVTETHYFNMTESELIETELGTEGGWEAGIKRIVESDNRPKIIAEFKKLILAAYGKKSDDGKRFVKSQELRDEFAQTAAYNALFMELISNDKAGADWIKGVMPKGLSEKAMPQDKPVGPPPAPRPPLPPTA